MKYRFAPQTVSFIESYSSRPPHAQLLTGPEGIGLLTLARHIATSNGRIVTEISPQRKTPVALPSISVDTIRRLYDDTKARFDKPSFFIIDDADTMNHSAQNALLKLLEEPNHTVRFILTSHTPESLLPTVRSRVAIFAVPLIPSIDTNRHIASHGVTDETMIRRLDFVANGLPAAITRLVESPNALEDVSKRIQHARRFVEGDTYRRLNMAAAIQNDRQAAVDLIHAIIKLLRLSLTTSSSNGSLELIERLLVASESIRANGNVKLHFSRAVVGHADGVL